MSSTNDAVLERMKRNGVPQTVAAWRMLNGMEPDQDYPEEPPPTEVLRAERALRKKRTTSKK